MRGWRSPCSGGIPPTLYYGRDLGLAVADVFLMIKGFIVFFVVSHLPITAARARQAVPLFLTLGVIALPFAAMDLAFGESFRALIGNPRGSGERHGLPSVVGMFDHEGTAGWLFAFVAVIALAVYTVRRSNASLVLLTLFSTGALLTIRRKSLLGLAAVFAVAVFLQTGHRSFLRTAVVTTLIVVVVFFAVGDVVVAVFEDLLDHYVLNPNLGAVARNAMYIASIQIAADYFPFGAGFTSFGGWISVYHYSPLYYEYGLSNHYGLSERNPVFQQDAFWPHVLGEMGFIGCALFILAILSLMRSCMRAAKNAGEPLRILGIASVLALVEAFVESIGSVVFEKTIASSFIFGLMAVTLLLERSSSDAGVEASGR